MQAREWKLRLGLDARCRQDAHVLCFVAALRQQRGLPQSRIPGNDQRSTPPASRLVEKRDDATKLLLPPDEHLLNVLQRRD
jgi:hypothetical protein